MYSFQKSDIIMSKFWSSMACLRSFLWSGIRTWSCYICLFHRCRCNAWVCRILASISNVIFFFSSSCHLPILYVGLEYSLTNNLRLAERLYSESLKFYPDDPAVLHELGVINYLNREYHHALLFFQRVLIKVEAIDQVDLLPYWEPLFNNMGHACRKLK